MDRYFYARFIAVSNKLRPHQSDAMDTAGQVTGDELVEAFNRPTMRYGKMSPCATKAHGIAQILLSFGTTWVNKNDFLLSYYTGVILPAYKRNRPHYLFNPVVGPNGHFGFTLGFNTELPLQPENRDYSFKLFATGEVHYLLHGRQIRTLDLIGKPWSRYMLLRRAITQLDGTIIGDTTPTPAVNAFTQPVRVHPWGFGNLAGGFTYMKNGFTIEAGYQLWVHPSRHSHLLR